MTLVTGQIVFLECRQTRLYAEVIQVLALRPTGWIRPLALVSETEMIALGADFDATSLTATKPAVPDMLWPLEQLQPALDTEVIPLLASLSAKSPNSASVLPPDSDRRHLTVNEFVQWLWADRQASDPSSFHD
ncbi:MULTISPECIES: hypothetical protein [unclassified Nodosilinea]|uniref:Uncharacterized protein n=1 Tax=Leptolyngbya subtilissima DQ-A4 TaxID=2933933 RepID=A0ABV0K016_9CYAN|nr:MULTISPECIES: hypothetical protein [unclassified Nodosilinea]MBD2109352.1 hypothetical protein [Nodosilinea sp. FACHB-13]MBD2111906.1 hypothetical protein [Nodosilinea sp. FACHB-141]